uniref:DUF3715 domain-containing protein n=1 Tax=Scophthalmus maximus TaxID=52904 RepID=A0A8D3A9B3_SCOMX
FFPPTKRPKEPPERIHVSLRNSILAPLRSAYLYEESKQSFRYTSAVLVKNARLEQKYEAFRANRRQAGYSEEVMEETYGFLLFDDINKAHALGETGVLTGNGTCTTLGDPGKGVYISMYSDCLDLNRWYHGKSGYIAIIRLTKGRVKQVLENYTQNFTSPTVGFDCHVSEELPSVSAETSCFLAFERTQYYMYELLDGGSTETDQSPSAACPFAIVSFSYTDTKATLVQPQETRYFCHYLAWTGQLQIGTKFYDVGLRSTAGALIPTKLPPVVKVDRAISMPDLIQLLPRAAFETCFSGEGEFFQDFRQNIFTIQELHFKGMILSLLTTIIHLKLHVFVFFVLDNGSNATEVLQGMFIFPGSRVIERGTKSGQRKATISSEILRVLPVLSYAEGEVEKTPFNSTEELCEVLAQHMQTYAALINPRLDFSPSREVIIFPDQYDVRDDHKHLYSSPEWTNKSIQSFRSYMSKPVSFQLPVSKASGILAAGQEEQREDLDDDVYICLSSPEQAPASPVGMGSEDQLTDQNSCITSTEAQVCLITVPHNVVPDDLQAGDATKVNEKSDLTVLIKTDEAGAKKSLTPPTSDDLSAELIVSITSAEQTVTNERLNAISTVPATKYDDFQIPGFSAPKLQTEGVSTLHDETVEIKKDCQEVTNFIDTKQKEVRRGHSKCLKKASESCVEILSLQTVKIPGGNNISISQKANQAKESSGHSQLNNTDWRKSRRRKRIFGKLSPRNKKLRRAPVGLTVAEEQKTDPGQQSLEDTILMELEICPLKKKTERWDLRPVISECGRILVPHGYVDMADQIQSLKHKLQYTPVNAHDNVEMEQESTTAPETAVDETEVNTSKDGGNHLQNVVNSHLDNEHGLLRQSDNGLLSVNPESSEQSSKNGCIDTPPSEEVKETKSFFPGKCTTKGEFLLSKLKSVLLKAKRKHNSLGSEVTKTDTDQNTEPCLKKGKDDSDVDALKSNAITSVHDTNVGVKDVTKLLSVDPLFAYALGLTPKEKPETVQKTEGWLHFQTPACFPAEKLKNKSCTRDNSVRTTVKEKKMNNCCSSTDALNLLADLALSASNDQVPPQPALEGKPETSLKKLGLTKDETNAEQESLLHALLRQPAARPFQPLESPSPSPPVGDTELVSLISKEHAYSLHPSSPLLLGLPGSPFQASPLSGSTKMLHHQQQLYGDGIQTAQPTVRQKDRGERNHKTQEYLKKHVVCRRKFRYSRTFVDKDGSVQVTKQWDENYDFNRDSKFASDSKSKAVMRALHGPWDFSIHDNTEEVRLIVHMWIGLFYSRSTARYFHVDSNFTNLCLEDSDSLEMSSGMESAPAKSEQKANSFGAFPSITDTEDHSDSKALDLSKNDDSVLDQGSLILDLSLRNSSAVNDISSHNESAKTCSPSQKAGCLEHIDIPSFIGNGSFSPPQVETESRSLWTENVQTTSGIGHMSHGCNNEEAHMKNDIENSQTSEMSLVQKYATDLSKSMTDKDVESNKEADEVAHADENDEIQSQDGKNWEVKENPREVDNIQPSPEVIHTGDGSLYKESDIVCNGNCFGNEKLSSREETIAVSSGQAENVNEDVDFCTVHNDKMTENPLGKDDRLDEDDSGVSAVETDSDMSNQPLHMMCDGPDSVQDCFTDCSRHAPFLEQPPQAFQDSKLEKLCADGSALTDELAISEKAPHMPYEMEPVHNVPAVEENSENYSCLADEAHYQKATLPISDEGICSLDGSCVARFIPPTKDSLETGNSDDHEDQETNLNVTERKDGNSSQEESFHHQSHSPQCEARKRCEEEAVTGETDLKMNKSTEGRETSHSGLIIPSIAIDIVQLHISHSQDKVEEVVQDQKGIQFISETACSDLPEDVCSTSETYSRKEELSRTQTPTLDEKPFDCIPCSGPGISTEKTCINTTPRCLSKSSTPISDKMPLEQKLCHKSRVNSDPISHDGQHHDLEQRTLRVLQSIDKFLSKSNQLTNDMKNCLDQKPNLFRKYTPPCLVPSHTSPLAVVSASTSQELPKESSDDFLVSPYKSQLEEVLGVKLQVKKTDSPLPKHSFERPDAFQETSIGQVYCHSYRSSPSTECFQTIETDVDQGGDMPQSNLNNRPHSYSQSPVMAVNPSKSDESQSDCIPKDGLIERSPKNKLTKTPTVNYTTPTPMPLEKKTDIFEENSGLNGDKQECSEFSSKSNLLSNVNDSNLDEATLSSSLSMHSFELEKSGGHQGFLTHSLLEKVGQTTKENNEMDQKDCSEAPASYVDDKDNNMIDDSLILGPQTSLTCTVFNTSQKRSHSFLEQVSQRCLQDDPTQASMEQECLIFSEQMKQLSKKSKSKRGPSQQDKHDKLTSSCASPVTVHFSSLEEQEDSLDLLDASSLARQKIKVDMSDRKDRADSKEEEGTLHPEKLSQGTGNLKEPAVVSCVTAKCAELYEAMMDDVCAVGKVPPKPKHLGKSCKTKYRFYMLVTSDDALFDETKLEAVGHTAVQPSEFFLGEGSSSSLLIILRNEDIAEHICEVPHLLELKKAPGVLFAGIDEPDDVVNLTHQELFTRGGFIMFDRAALEPLSLCNMEKCSEILRVLSRTGKWKWLLHYRDSRRLKENARLSAEDKEKKCFLNSCEDTGFLEVLPYHECDLMSRDQPDYLSCLVRLQVQNISARYPIFITDSAFGRNGILTMTVNSFLEKTPSETFYS